MAARVEVFERYVNSKDNQTIFISGINGRRFERYVNSKDNQTCCLKCE